MELFEAAVITLTAFAIKLNSLLRTTAPPHTPPRETWPCAPKISAFNVLESLRLSLSVLLAVVLPVFANSFANRVYVYRRVDKF